MGCRSVKVLCDDHTHSCLVQIIIKNHILINSIFLLFGNNLDTNQVGCWGFRGTPNNGKSHSYDKAHLTMTFAALNTLLILEDDLSRVDRLAIIKGLRQYQDENGRSVKIAHMFYLSLPACQHLLMYYFLQLLSFCPIVGEESDMRFVYCAASICFLLKDWTSVNVDLMVDYIQSCLASVNQISFSCYYFVETLA